jgi:hypothetical protein
MRRVVYILGLFNIMRVKVDLLGKFGGYKLGLSMASFTEILIWVAELIVLATIAMRFDDS